MAKFSVLNWGWPVGRIDGLSRSLLWACGFVSMLVLSACTTDVAVEVQNRQASQELARQSQPPGSVYTGWRTFQNKCAACHGPAATGGAGGPNLLPRVNDMGPRQFVSLVLKRYDWNNSIDKAKREGATREALIEDILQRKEAALVMPAWEGEPSVTTHIADLYAYLSARAQGTQGPNRPEP